MTKALPVSGFIENYAARCVTKELMRFGILLDSHS